MVSPKRLLNITMRWQKLAAIGRRRRPRRRISMSKENVEPCKKSTPSKGIVYTRDGRQFVVPLAYHNSLIFQELFKWSKDEYGLPSDGTIPSNAAFM
ncbi:hypothetical protein ACLOJK_024125 [Asimina triloba]